MRDHDNYNLMNIKGKVPEEKIDGFALILFLLWPFAGVLFSFFRLDRKVSLFILGAFCLFFGWTFNPVNELLDSFRYAIEFRMFSTSATSNISFAISDYLNGEKKDIYTSICYYFINKIGGDIHVLFLLFSAVFSFFAIKSISIIVKQPEYKNNIICLLLMFILVYSNSIFNINGVRYWTAAWMAVYSVLKILIEKEKRYFLLLLIVPLVHGSFWVFLPFFIIACVIKFRINLLLVVFWISFLLSELVLTNLDYLVGDWLPPFAQHLIYAYTESSSALAKLSGENIENQPLYWKILTALPHYYEMFLVSVLALNAHKLSAGSTRLIVFLLSYLIMVNIGSGIPSIGRFYFLATAFIVLIWIKERSRLSSLNKLIYLIPLFYLYVTFQLFRDVISTNGYLLFIPAPILNILS